MGQLVKWEGFLDQRVVSLRIILGLPHVLGGVAILVLSEAVLQVALQID